MAVDRRQRPTSALVPSANFTDTNASARREAEQPISLITLHRSNTVRILDSKSLDTIPPVGCYSSPFSCSVAVLNWQLLHIESPEKATH